ncbi:MAG: HNH endonuclease [Limnohabitans sp.]
MSGRIRRKLLAQRIPGASPPALPVCPLCGREVPVAQQDAHHLVPRSQGGRETVILHRICHRQIHALLSESELAREYATPQALLRHPQVQAFVQWVRRKPDDFFERSRKTARLRD